MEVDGGPKLVTESQKVWREVQESLRNEDYEKAVQLCNAGTSSCSPVMSLKDTEHQRPMICTSTAVVTCTLVQVFRWQCDWLPKLGAPKLVHRFTYAVNSGSTVSIVCFVFVFTRRHSHAGMGRGVPTPCSEMFQR